MDDSVIVRRFEEVEWPTYRELRLRALAESPDAFGSTLAVEQSRTAAEWSTRLSAGVTSQFDLPLLALAAGTPGGLAWAKVDQADFSLVNIFQMWVAPEFRGQGLGGRLLHAGIAWARAREAKAVCLSVTLSESPAMRMYRAAGFQPSGPAEPLRPGSDLLAQPMVLRLNEAPPKPSLGADLQE
jgi:GNAT superfamily N-acetyltransferase